MSRLKIQGTELIQPTSTSTKQQGMGMGLSICRSIIELYGGRIWASPAAIRGSIVKFMRMKHGMRVAFRVKA